jgi:hypothetical protein
MFSNDFAVVSIDSRSTDPLHPETPPNDQYCKIITLSDDLVFFGTGMVAVKEDNQVILDAAAAARDVFGTASHPADLVRLLRPIPMNKPFTIGFPEMTEAISGCIMIIFV